MKRKSLGPLMQLADMVVYNSFLSTPTTLAVNSFELCCLSPIVFSYWRSPLQGGESYRAAATNRN